MYLNKPVKYVLIATAVVFVFATLFSALTISGSVTYFSSHRKDVNEVTLRNFTPGALVDYNVLSGKDVIAQKKAHVDDHGTLSLAIDEKFFVEDKPVKYELKVAKPDSLKKEEKQTKLSDNNQESDPAEMLDLMLSLNPQDGKIGLSVKGLDEFSDIILTENDQELQKLSADWSGMFSTSFGGTGALKAINPDAYNKLQLAFMGAGIQSDLLTDATGMPVIEAQITGLLLGENSRDKNTSQWSGPFTRMTEQFSAVMAQQTMLVGMFIDASIQLESQRKIQELHARAHKDYHPSEQMCRVGSFVRSIAHSERKSELDKAVLNRYLINQYTGIVHSTAAAGVNAYEEMKIHNYMEHYCNTADNAAASAAICDAVVATTSAETLERKNKDIDYTRTIETKLTLDIDFTDGTIDPDEEDVFAMARYLYFPTAFNAPEATEIKKNEMPHYDSRSYAAKMGVAHNSFINIIGMKSSAPQGQPTTTTTTSPDPAPFGTGSPVEPSNNVRSTVAGTGVAASGQCTTGAGNPCIQTEYRTTRDTVSALTEDSGWAYMKAMLRELKTIDLNTGLEVALSDAEIDEILGERPSYYAQMEVLTKKIYQNPEFYVNLYDKPANVKRLGAAMDAILLMNQRDRFESLLRREMLSATMIENALYERVDEVNSGMFEEMQQPQIKLP